MDITSEQAMKLRKECEVKIALSDSLLKLEKNKDFKTLITDYLTGEPVRLIQLLGEPSFNMSDKKSLHREEIKEQMIGVARFAEYLRRVHLQADKAEQTIKQLDEATYSE